jgi:hypothetical protein
MFPNSSLYFVRAWPIKGEWGLTTQTGMKVVSRRYWWIRDISSNTGFSCLLIWFSPDWLLHGMSHHTFIHYHFGTVRMLFSRRSDWVPCADTNFPASLLQPFLVFHVVPTTIYSNLFISFFASQLCELL